MRWSRCWSPSLELLSLRDTRDATLTITGLVQNPRGGAALSRVTVTAYAFDDKGVPGERPRAAGRHRARARRRIAVRGVGASVARNRRALSHRLSAAKTAA